MIFKQQNGRLLAFLPTWRLIVVVGMYCASCVQIGAWIIFTIEQKPIHPLGQFILLFGSGVFFLLGNRFGKADLQRMRACNARLEVTRAQSFVLILGCAMVPATLLLLVILSDI